MILGCMTELPCPYQKDFDGMGNCIKEEGNCEYQILNSEDKKQDQDLQRRTGRVTGR